MRYIGMPLGMWWIYRRSFTKALVTEIGLDAKEAKNVKKAAKAAYLKMIERLPGFEKGDIFQMNIVNCALFASFYLSLKSKPSLDVMTAYYRQAMGNAATKYFCMLSGKRKFTKKTYATYMKVAKLHAGECNPYSWNMSFLPYKDGTGYECRFTKCGICYLMKELGIAEATPALCALDYAMNEWGGASIFKREYTLASGGPYCDCGYIKK